MSEQFMTGLCCSYNAAALYIVNIFTRLPVLLQASRADLIKGQTLIIQHLVIVSPQDSYRMTGACLISCRHSFTADLITTCNLSGLPAPMELTPFFSFKTPAG